MLADGALLGGLGDDLDVAAHGAHPHLHFLAAEHLVVLDALDEQLIAVLVALLDGGQALEEVGQIGEALLAGGFVKSLNVVNDSEKAIWLIDYWCSKDIRGLIQMPFSRHWIMHTEACLRIKNKIHS